MKLQLLLAILSFGPNPLDTRPVVCVCENTRDFTTCEAEILGRPISLEQCLTATVRLAGQTWDVLGCTPDAARAYF